MPFAVKCPKCLAAYQVPDHLEGKQVGCRKCEILFRARSTITPAVAAVASLLPQQSPTALTPSIDTTEPELEVMEEPEDAPLVPMLADDPLETVPKAPARKPGRSLTWSELEHRKRRRGKSTSDEEQEPLDNDSPEKPLPLPHTVLKRVGIAAGILLVLLGLGFGIYFASRSEPVPTKLQPTPLADISVAPVAEPTTIASLGEPFGITATPFEGNSFAVDLGAEIEDIAIGAGGRLLVLKLVDRNELQIFDVSQAKVVRKLPIAEGARFAAGTRKLVVSNPARNVIQRWDFWKEKQDFEVALPKNQTVSMLALGAASDGPVLMELTENNPQKPGVLKSITFLDLETLQNGGFLNRERRVVPGEPTYARASLHGNLFTYWTTKLGAGESELLQIEAGELRARTNMNLGGPLTPSADGSFIFTPTGKYATNLKSLGTTLPAGTTTLPSVHGSYCVQITSSLPARQTSDGKPANRRCKFKVLTAANDPILELDEILFPLSSGTAPQDQLGQDRRALLIPAATVMVVIPNGSTQLYLYRANLTEALEKNNPQYLLITGLPPVTYHPGEAYVYPVEVVSSRGGVTYNLVNAPPGMTISREGVVSWSVPADYERLEVQFEIEATDQGGNQKASQPVRIIAGERPSGKIPFPEPFPGFDRKLGGMRKR